MTPRSRRNRAGSDASDPGPDQAQDVVADRGKHAAHLAVSTFVDDKLDIRGVVSWKIADEMDALGRRGLAVLEHYPGRELSERLVIGPPADRRQIGLGDVVARMGHVVEKITVVGQKQQAFGLDIEPAHRPQHRAVRQIDQFGHDVHGVWIGERAGVAARLVEGDVLAPLGHGGNRAAVDRDFVDARFGLRAEFADDDTVDRDAPVLNPLLARSPRSEPGGGENFL